MIEEALLQEMRTAIDGGMRSYIDGKMNQSPEEFKEMICYPLGWSCTSQEKYTSGKRIRPIMLLLTCHTLGGEWKHALPAAVGTELLHNFTLIHDDIQDHSRTRHGRDTVWVKWGEAQAINAGDAMYALACSAAYDLRKNFSSDVVLTAVEEFHRTAFLLTGGQFLDMAFEKAEEIEIEDYWKMIRGKTGELISSCFSLGALLAGKTPGELGRFKDLGLKIGTAFQVQDDWLGIWGDQSTVGKSVQSDLRERKKTYPILLALRNMPEFRDYWNTHQSFSDADISALKGIIDKSQINGETREQFQKLYNEVIQEYSILFGGNSAATALKNLITNLLIRSV